MNYILSFQCNFCGWDWIGGFAYCPNCKGDNIRVLDFESIGEFTERMMLMEMRQNTGFFVIDEELDLNDKI